MRSCRAVLAAVALTALVPGVAHAELRSCKPVRDPFPDTRYEKADLTRIKTTLRSCGKARRVARNAQWKALGIQPVGATKTFAWKGWLVNGDIRPSRDRYVARTDEHQVRWRF